MLENETLVVQYNSGEGMVLTMELSTNDPHEKQVASFVNFLRAVGYVISEECYNA